MLFRGKTKGNHTLVSLMISLFIGKPIQKLFEHNYGKCSRARLNFKVGLYTVGLYVKHIFTICLLHLAQGQTSNFMS